MEPEPEPEVELELEPEPEPGYFTNKLNFSFQISLFFAVLAWLFFSSVFVLYFDILLRFLIQFEAGSELQMENKQCIAGVNISDYSPICIGE